ncbi:hypothetical protein PV10_07172 [Exophiala mesophila]|uniref:Transcriptional regulatory protein DEP1 n=1 Tax=Exophiala mesophila TaxID=212818 RepID=A0A0D1Z4R8_EXOME|nr:uncharacterized protein PV10_07172 [Exophiala mesophila]KIV89797.1 hypothetical protein PV10_07172 [Exophiala mesophila]
MDSAVDSLLALSNTAAAIAAQDDPASDDDRSSSLSELDDNLDGDSQDEEDDIDPTRPVGHESEAETERLQVTPDNLQRKKPVEISPSKLAHSQDVDMRPEIESLTESPPSSPRSSHPDSDIESALSDAPDGDDDENEPAPEVEKAENLSSPNKRKRQESESDPEHLRRSQRRRTGSIDSDEEKSEPESEIEDSRQPSREASAEPPQPEVAGDDPPDHEEEPEDPPDDEQKEPEKDESSEDSKGKTRTRAKRRGQPAVQDPQPTEEEEGDGEVAEESDTEENDVDAHAKSEEEQANRVAAMDALIGLEKHFAQLRDRLYDERIAAINHELALLQASKPCHPELLRQLQVVQKYRDDKFEVEQKLLVYKIGALKNKSVAERSQTQSAYFQTIRDVREKYLEKISEHFYRIQRDRFKADSTIPNFTIPFPTRRSQQILQQTAYNKEVSILSGVAKYVGFPAAPELAPSKQKDIEDDIQKMGISLPQVRPVRPTQRPMQSNTSQMSAPQAEEQFLEQTPWANPQHPIHRLASQRQSSNRSPFNTDVFVTPANQQRTTDNLQTQGSASTIPDPSAQLSSLANTPQEGISSTTKLEQQGSSVHNYRLHSASPLDRRAVPPFHDRHDVDNSQSGPAPKEHIRDLPSSPLNARANVNVATSPPRAHNARPEKVTRMANNESPFLHKDTGITTGGLGGFAAVTGRFSVR